MRIDFHGLVFETPCATFYIWSPWRATALEHRLWEAVKSLPRMQVELGPDEVRINITDPRAWRAALQALSRVLKGWQEESDLGREKRSWRWLLEADTDPDGYDHAGEPVSLWAFLRAVVERGGPGESEKPEETDLEGFGFRVWPEGNTPAGTPRG